MLTQLTLVDEVIIALRGLRPEDRKLINPALAEKAFALVLKKRTRTINPVKDKREAVRYTLSELHVGASGWREKRRKVFAAYWRLLRKLLDNREDRNKWRAT